MGRNRIEVVLGRKKSGKSSLVKRWLKRFPRWIVWDSQAEYFWREDGTCRYEHSHQHYSFDAFLAWVRTHRTIERHVISSSHADFDRLCAWCMKVGNVLLVLEEVDQHCPNGQSPEPLREILRRGRHRSVSIIAVSQRPPNVPKDLLQQADGLILFSTTEPRDIEYFGDKLGKGIAERLRTVPRHHFLRVRT